MKLAVVLLSPLVCLNMLATTFYVDITSTNPTPPYSDWSTAATNIQDAIDGAAGGDLVMVNPGTYQSGGRIVYGSLTNRVVLNKAVSVQSVQGAAYTVIGGGGALDADYAVRCAYLTNGAALIGFTLTSGGTRTAGDVILEQSGAGAYCESPSSVLSNCVIAGNRAWLNGGGVFGGTLLSCTLSSNHGGGNGGAACSNTLNNCSLTTNTAGFGGAVYGCLATNCTLVGNSCVNEGGGAESGVLDSCIIAFNSASYGGGGESLPRKP